MQCVAQAHIMATAITRRPEDSGTSSGNTELESVGGARIAYLRVLGLHYLRASQPMGLKVLGSAGYLELALTAAAGPPRWKPVLNALGLTLWF